VFGLDVRSLALFRICLALLLIGDLLYRGQDLQAHYTDAGVMPLSLLALYQESHYYLTLHALNGSFGVQLALFLISGLAALFLLVGYRTRTAAIVSWILLISLQNRNPLIIEGGDAVLRMLLFWGMFLPLGACWSLDRSLNRAAPPPPTRIVSVGSAALIVQIGVIYWFTAMLKSGATWRSENTAVYYALSLDQFATPLAKSLLAYPQLLKALTFITWRLELLGLFLILFSSFSGPLRTLVVFVYIGFHVSLGLCLELGLFPLICSCGWLVLLPEWFWQQALKLQSRLPARFLAAPAQAMGRRFPAWRGRLRPPPPGIALHWTAQIVAGFCLVYILLWNMRVTNFRYYVHWLPTKWDWIGETTRLDQDWTLFAPNPMREHGWIVVPAELTDGTEVDLQQEVSPVSWDPPALISATYINDRWRKYLLNLCIAENQGYRVFYANYLARQWDSIHTPDRHVKKISLYYVRRYAQPGYKLSAWERVPLLTADITSGTPSDTQSR
jgi:hypothetical protein